MRDERAEVMFRIMRVSLHERALALDSLLNRLISLSFARQLHETFHPSPQTSAIDRAITELGIAVRKDTVARLRAVLELVRNGSVRDARSMQRFAIDQALAIGARDMPWRIETERLWDSLNARGFFLGRREARFDFGVAASS
jgi:hypothetical protein